MLDSQQKRKVKSLMYHKVTLVILFLLVLLALRSTWVVYYKKVESERLEKISLDRRNELDGRNKELTSQIERLNTESGIEAEIRSKFSVAKDNEKTVVIVDDSSTTSIASSTNSLWQRIKSFFSR
jgi:cell division protein FtsB